LDAKNVTGGGDFVESLQGVSAWRHPSSSTNAARAVLVERFVHAWLVPRCTRTSVMDCPGSS
jgi:hypothetical protein